MMQIRPFKESDAKAVTKLWLEVFPDNPPHNNPVEDISRKLKIQREFFIIAEAESEIVGTAMAGYDGHRGWVYYVAVSPDYRKQGIGRALMEYIENSLKEIGCPKLNLQVRTDNYDTVEFYKKLGYSMEERISMGKILN